MYIGIFKDESLFSEHEQAQAKFLRVHRKKDVAEANEELYQMRKKYHQVGNMSGNARKLDFCLCENRGADQLRSNCEADQRLCFRYTDSTISLLLTSEISSF